ncbi:MAG TPA: carboxypeptidase regulatory-like domain-containing protein [Gemmatimonadaceae bacterium]
MIVRSAVLLFALAFVASAQPARGASAVIFGGVSDTALRPIVGADVNFAGSRVRASTDSLGRFQIVRVPRGKFILIVRNVGFRPAVEEIEVKDGDTLRLAFTLPPTTQGLATVLVTERGVSQKLKEFDQRRRLGFGEFFTHADIEKINAVGIEDILRRTKSVRVSDDGRWASSAREGMLCPTAIYVDGFPMGNIRLDHLPSPKEIAAIEVYGGSATLPLWLATGPTGAKRGCGVILIWTNDGSIVP